MPQLLPRAFACARNHGLAYRALNTPIINRSISYKPNPDPVAPTVSHKNASEKIPQSKRPLERGPLPLPTITPEALAEAPYIVRRTAFAQLPVYRKWMSGGTRQVVMVKKISGQKAQLVDELKEKLEVPTDKIRVSPTTGHVELQVCCALMEHCTRG